MYSQDTFQKNSHSEEDSGPFWIVVRNKQLGRSDRLTQIQSNNIKFVVDTSQIYNALKQMNKLWTIQRFREGARIQNLKSKNFLKINIEDGNFKNLACVPFDEQNPTQFLWNIELNFKYKAFVIQSIAQDKNKTRYQLLLNWDLKQQEKQRQYSQNKLKLYSQKQFEVSKDGIIGISQRARIERVVQVNVQQGKLTEKQLQEMRAKIPGFSGYVFENGASLYRFLATQYASSSYPQSLMSPHMICYPKNVQDVKAALIYALNNNKKVVARSGGHQYSGKSSGDLNTLVVDMGSSHFIQIKKNQEKQGLIDVYPGARLREISKFLVKNNASLPHGQCPLVCIGGHGQTGGYGNLLRSFGLNADFIQGFEIVTTDGKEVKVYQLTRPHSNYLKRSKEVDQKFNNQFFTGVLSGNAGSFGIITRYTYRVIKDQDHKNVFCQTIARGYNKELFIKLLEEFRQWTIKIRDEKDQDDMKGLDYFVSLGSKSLPNWFNTKFRFSPLVTQLLYADLDGKPYAGQYDNLIKTLQQGRTPAEDIVGRFLTQYTNTKPTQIKQLSKFAASTVRRWPTIKANGRQFNQPYFKRSNLTADALTPQFLKQFCDFIDQVYNSELQIVCQMQCSGGQSRRKARELRKHDYVVHPHRQTTYGFTFDIFYRNEEQKAKAKIYQDKLGNILAQHYNHGPQRRFFWASFDNTDITNPQIQKMYYDNEDDYRKLQELKAKVDPKDLFHTSLTVKLPQK